jgi:hypothetical protein
MDWFFFYTPTLWTGSCCILPPYGSFLLCCILSPTGLVLVLHSHPMDWFLLYSPNPWTGACFLLFLYELIFALHSHTIDWFLLYTPSLWTGSCLTFPPHGSSFTCPPSGQVIFWPPIRWTSSCFTEYSQLMNWSCIIPSPFGLRLLYTTTLWTVFSFALPAYGLDLVLHSQSTEWCLFTLPPYGLVLALRSYPMDWFLLYVRSHPVDWFVFLYVVALNIIQCTGFALHCQPVDLF